MNVAAAAYGNLTSVVGLIDAKAHILACAIRAGTLRAKWVERVVEKTL